MHHPLVHGDKNAHGCAKHLGVLRQLHQAAFLVLAVYADGAVQILAVFKATAAIRFPQRSGIDQRWVAIGCGTAHGLTQLLQALPPKSHHAPGLEVAA